MTDRFPWSVVILTLCVGYIFANWQTTPPQATENRLLLIDVDDSALNDWAEENAYSIERTTSLDRLTLSPPWAMMADEGTPYAPCVVVQTNGIVEVLPITDNLLDALDARWNQ